MKSIQHLLLQCVKQWGVLVVLVCGLSVVMKSLSLMVSFMLGSVASGLLLWQMSRQQIAIAQQKKQSLVLIGLFFRLGLYGVVISLAFFLKVYLNLLVVLLSLFTFQGLYVVGELWRNWKHFRKRSDSWTA